MSLMNVNLLQRSKVVRNIGMQQIGKQLTFLYLFVWIMLLDTVLRQCSGTTCPARVA
jgi:hypothetical protein